MKCFLILTALFTLFPGFAQAESFKCGDKFVSIGDSKAVVLLRCGEPFFAEVISADDERKVEQWTYRKSQKGSFLRILTFSGGRLVDIKVGERAD
jgi:hypothetical protein